MRDAVWIGVIVAALAAIGGGYVQGVLSARPPPLASIRSSKSESHVLPAAVRDSSHAADVASIDAFSSDDVVVERARPVAESWRREEIAVFVGLCGTSIAVDSGFLRLRIPLAFVVDPHATQARKFAQMVRDAGDELFVQFSEAPAPATLASLQRVVGTFDGVASRDATGVAASLRGSGLAYFDERGDADAAEFARQGVPLVRRDVTADDRSGTGYIAFMLDQAAAMSRRTGTIVVLVRPQPSTLNALRAFANGRNDVVAATPR